MGKNGTLKNEWALILGGSSGLGLATAKKLARHGFNILVVHRDRRIDFQIIEEEFKSITLNNIELKSYHIDATNPERRMATIKEIYGDLEPNGRIKVLVHSIAKGNLKPMHSDVQNTLNNQDFHLTMDAMAISLYDWTKALIAAKLFAEDARIISFTSEGNSKAWENYAAVSAAKAALEAITRNMALEFAPMGIKANCVQAGMTLTNSFNMIPGSEKLKKHALKRNPSGRLTTPEDVANVVYLLTTEEAKWITGTVLKVDGGESLR
ncbi:short-chain dehydrogenase [Sediminicola sp. YIK13]|uniref:enoyl-ACP reductase FabI n=1 Tax=Sediminicola sp. YIK13 TaxID=1453352 RepID=UPI0007224C1F|nr:SDR family oxidoreductase [Sediminicola sp. YIK13]ALM07019.1 short-chain dehydrogenase [Sediminicola sp. YIK13]